ncbi:MAG: hypothetical protein AAGD38_00595 [Acidobacteriota bacterium]
MALDSPSAVAGNLARLVAVTGDLKAVDTMYQTYEAITVDDLKDAASTYLIPTRRTVAILRSAS